MNLNNKKDREEYWNNKAEKLLLGRQIVKVEYLSDEEAEEGMWYSKPVCFQLDDGTWLMPMRDDEGNDGGALSVVNDKSELGCLPVLSVGGK